MPFSKDLLIGASGNQGGGQFYEYLIEQSVRLQRSTTSNTGTNGSGFYRDQADIPTPTDSKKFKILKDIDLAEYFITSKAEKIESKNKDELSIKVIKSKGIKCPRSVSYTHLTLPTKA